MSELDGERPTRSGRQPLVALVAPSKPGQRIGALLEQQDLAVDSFAAPEELMATPADVHLALIVLWLTDSHASPAREIEPVSRRFPLAPVLLVCQELRRWKVRAVLNSGVSGITLERELATALGPCLRAILAGQVCVPRELREQIEPPVLSTREKQVLGLVVMGYMNSQIAQQLFLAESTVKSHLSSAFAKLGVRSRNEAVELIVDPEQGLGTGILALGGEPLVGPTLELGQDGVERAASVPGSSVSG
jgi:DNA-binding NarL/FixJ family response regulator